MGGCPIATVPAGFSEGGLPMGLQLMGPNHAELACLQLARAYEKATGWVEKRKPDAL
jgi:amidase